MLFFGVTPCVGVWIEIINSLVRSEAKSVTPCVGVWIEIGNPFFYYAILPVTPCVGVWIEIHSRAKLPLFWYQSLPAWECGLK